MDYNTSRKKLELPEYGRNIHKLVEFAMNIEDRDERNRMIRGLIAVMGNMNPHLRDIADFKHKLWDHIAIMSDFKLDIDSPYPIPEIEKLKEKPSVVPYNQHRIKYKYYGVILEQLIKKAANMPEGESRDNFIESITNHMKKSYVMWNKEVVADDVIYDHLNELSGGKIVPNRSRKLADSRDIKSKNKKKIHHFERNNGSK